MVQSSLAAGRSPGTDRRPAGPAAPGLREVVQSFHEISEAIAAGSELDLILHLVARHITSLLGIDRCSVYLRDERSGLFRGQVGETVQDSDPSIKRLTCGGAADGFTREIVATRRPVLILNAQNDPRPVRATMRAWGVRDILGVPMVHGGEVIGLLFLDDSTAPHPFSQDDQDLAASFADLAGMGISQAIRAAELVEQRTALERRNETARRSTVIDERLTTLALEAADLQEIARAISQLTEKACAIHGSRLQRMGFAAGVAQDAPAARILEPEQRRIPEVAAALRELRARRPTIVGPFPRAGLAHRAMVTRVTAGEEDLGYVVLAETRSRFTELDVAASRRSAMIVAFELVAQRRAAEADLLAREILVRDLLRDTEDDGPLRRRAAMLDVDLDRPAVVALLRAHEDDGPPLTVEDVRRAEDALDGVESVGITATDDGAVAVVLPLDPGLGRQAASAGATAAAEALRGAVAGPARRVFAALSSTCREPADYHGAFAEATSVQGRIRREREGDRTGPWTASAERLGVGRLFLSADQRADVHRFAVDTLGPLLGPDERSRTLLATLRAYFAAAGNTKGAAELLGVHSNTVRYRLANVHEATGMDVALNAEDQLTAHLAINALDDEARGATRTDGG
jgi:GAF domain-containing protein/sugar diacid utilization regulator